MWILRAKAYTPDSKLTQAVKRNNVRLHYYPINNYSEKGRQHFIMTAVIQGKQNSIERFFRDIKKLKNVKTGRKLDFLEREGTFFTMITSHSLDVEDKIDIKLAYNPSLIHYKPVIWWEDGWEEVSIASPDRKVLEKMILACRELCALKILEFKQKKLSNFGFLSILPEITNKQKKAIELAMEQGYYEHPRRIGLQKLAEMSKLALSTYQVHLRKAEIKLLPYIISKYK